MSADFTPEKEDYRVLSPFKMQVLTNFPYIEADFDALTNYQLLCKIVEYLNNVITNENEVTEQVTSLYNAFVSLQDYVNNYFYTLDLQPLIDEKLDEMAEDGTLADIIADYIELKGQLVYNSVAEMKEATNLYNGSFAKTYGYYSYNDGGGALYKITNTIDNTEYQEVLNNGLYATLITQYEVNILTFGINDTLDSFTWLNKLNNCINYCKLKNKILYALDLKLKNNIDLSNLNIKLMGNIILNNYSITIGNIEGYNTNSYASKKYYFDKIYSGTQPIGSNVGTGTVILKPIFFNSEVNINTFNGSFIIKTNDINLGVGYSTFNLGTTWKIRVEADETNPDGTPCSNINHWVNSNTFNLNRCSEFYVGEIYNFDDNQINGGCFEGNYKIILYTATKCKFSHMRFEGNYTTGAEIYLGEKTNNNIIEGINVTAYYLNINDKGMLNYISSEMFVVRTPMTIDSMSFDTPSSAFLLPQTDSESNTFYFTQSNGVPFYSTPFIENPKNVSFYVDSALYSDSGVVVSYKLYDKNFNTVEPKKNNSIVAYYMNTTSKDSLDRMTEGTYFIPNGSSFNAMGDAITDTMNNEHIILMPTPNFEPIGYDTENLALLNSIKYVRFFIKSLSWSEIATADTRFKSIIARTYKVGERIHLNTFQNVD